MLLTNEHSLTYNQKDWFAFFFEALIKAAIQVLRSDSNDNYIEIITFPLKSFDWHTSLYGKWSWIADNKYL